MNFFVGQPVTKKRAGPGYDIVIGRGIVAKISGRMITLEDGTKWRQDGYLWGSKPTRGIGRSFEPRIVPAGE